MPKTPAEVVRAILNDPLNAASVKKLVAPDATYVSLNFDNPELKRIMPWAGTSQNGGPEAIVGTYSQVNRYWTSERFQIDELFESDQRVAVFGRFTYRSKTLGREITSPFAIFARVEGEQVTYMQFMEDTFATASSFRVHGETTYRADPEGEEVTL